MAYFFDRDAEAARISFAGVLVALRATGVEIVEAALDYPDDPVLKIAPEQIVAGFDDQRFGKGNLVSCVGEHASFENPTMARRMLLAQVRCILAGVSALDFADVTGTLELLDADAGTSVEDWGNRLLRTYGELMDIDEQTLEVLHDEIKWDARRVVGRNWELVSWVYLFLREGDTNLPEKLRSSFFTRNAVDFPITASGADEFWREVEKGAAVLHDEEE